MTAGITGTPLTQRGVPGTVVTYTLQSASTGATIAQRIVRPKGWYGRTLGLLGQKDLAPGDGLWLDSCWGIHTVGMRFAIDVLFLGDPLPDPAGVVRLPLLDVCQRVRPGRLAIMHAYARNVIELPAGTCAASDLLPGDVLLLASASNQP